MNIENFIPSYVGEVTSFCVEDLAGILYKCVEHPEPRKEVDWRTAESYIKNNSIENLENLTRKFLILTSYEELRKNRTHLPEIVKDIYGKVEDFYELKSIKERILFLNNQEFSSLINGLDYNQRRAYQKIFLGRDVWDDFYQKIQDSEILKQNGYTGVVMG